MEITCPECGFSRNVPEDKLPPRSQMATCPKCQTKFRFRELDTFTIEERTEDVAEERPGSEDLGVSVGEPRPLRKTEQEPESSSEDKDASLWDRLESMDPKAGARDEAAAPDEEPASRDTVHRPEPVGEDMGEEGYEADPDEEEDVPEMEVPFENLETYGFFPGLFETIKRVMVSPKLFFETMSVRGGLVKPLIFYLLLSEFHALTQFFWGFAGIGSLDTLFTGAQPMGPEAEAIGLGLGSAIWLLLYPLILTVYLFLVVGVIHVFLLIMRTGKNGYEGTFRATVYSSCPIILAVVPLIGPIIAGVWSFILSFIGYKYVHRTTYPKVIMAFLLSVTVLTLFFLLLFMIAQGVEPTV